MKDKRRKVIVSPHNYKAYFHKWVELLKEECSQVFPRTYALIEYKSGEVEYVNPTDITFYDWNLDSIEIQWNELSKDIL